MTKISRRQALGGAAAVGAGVPLLAACGAGAGSGQPAASGEELAKTSQVPVGGGLVVADKDVILSQPKAGEFKAFSNVCTHMQCHITDLEGSKVVCGCHGSAFSVKDGSVINGPATQPLAQVQVSVKNGEIVKA